MLEPENTNKYSAFSLAPYLLLSPQFVQYKVLVKNEECLWMITEVFAVCLSNNQTG